MSSTFGSEEKLNDAEEVKLDDLWDCPSLDTSSSSSCEGAEPQVINRKVEDFKKGLYKPGSGEICAKYIAQSDSEIFKHIYYKYPAVTDPGIERALLLTKSSFEYPNDGLELYFAVCREMSQAPIRIFYENLVNSTIDLSYYIIDSNGVRPMAMALENNPFVRTLIFKETFLNDESCFHLGDMLKNNNTLLELNLEGCRIGLSGLKRILHGLLKNSTLVTLNLNRNELEDDGGKELGYLFTKLNIKELYMSYNNLSDETALVWAATMLARNELTVLDISWNNFATTRGLLKLLNRLSENEHLTTLDLSWNALLGQRLKKSLVDIFSIRDLAYLDLSHNRLQGEIIEYIAPVIQYAKKLVTLNLAYNPLTMNDAITILTPFKSVRVKAQNLFLDNVIVNEDFLKLLDVIKNKKFRQNFVITYGEVVKKFTPEIPDLRDIMLDRCEFLCKEIKPRKDIALFVYQLIKEGMTLIDAKEFEKLLKPKLNGELVGGLADMFPGPLTKKKEKKKVINLLALADYLRRKWPDRVLLEPKPKKARKKRAKAKKA